MGNWKVVFSSGCVTFATFILNPIGRMNRSSLTGFRVKPSPTNVALLTIRFQDLLLCFPVLRTLNISGNQLVFLEQRNESLPSSAIPRTFGRGTAYLAARSFLLSLMADDNAFASYPSVVAYVWTQVAHLLTLSVQQICGQSTILNSSIVLLLDIPLVVRLELLLHLNLFRVSLGMVQLGLVTKHLLGVGRCLVGLSSSSLSPIISGSREYRPTSSPRNPSDDRDVVGARPCSHSGC
jgi:hypothetical protein